MVYPTEALYNGITLCVRWRYSGQILPCTGGLPREKRERGGRERDREVERGGERGKRETGR